MRLTFGIVMSTALVFGAPSRSISLLSGWLPLTLKLVNWRRPSSLVGELVTDSNPDRVMTP